MECHWTWSSTACPYPFCDGSFFAPWVMMDGPDFFGIFLFFAELTLLNFALKSEYILKDKNRHVHHDRHQTNGQHGP
jgi:hypothetical protein